MIDSYESAGLQPSPETLVDVVANLRRLCESELIFDSNLTHDARLSVYFSAKTARPNSVNGSKAITFQNFSDLINIPPTDEQALRFAFIAISRTEDNGMIRITVRFRLGNRSSPSSIDYATLQHIFDNSLAIKNTIDNAKYFGKTPINEYANRFYHGVLKGSNSKSSVLAMVGAYATLDFLVIDIERCA